MESFEIFCNQIPEAVERFPKLKQACDDAGKIYVRGEIDIIDKEGNFWESFEVEIHHVDGFPFRFPSVFEVGGKIPRIADWHIYQDTLTCCLTVPPLEIIKCRNGITLLDFIQSEVLPYFSNQTHRRVEGFYVNGEYSHGHHGILEFFEAELQTSGDTRKTIDLLFKIANIEKPSRTADCFCGKKNKYRKCHRDAYSKLILIGKAKLLEFANIIASSSGNFDLIH